MKKFKLIKEYEGSPQLGTEVNKCNDFPNYNFNGGNYTTAITAYFVENSPEFWEEVKEEFPKIISFRSLYLNRLNVILRYDGEKCISRSDGMDPKYTISYSTALVDPKCEIYQVAVSETEVFTLGDKVKHPFNDSFDVISKFIICNDPKRDVVSTLDRPDMIGKIVANVGNYFGNCNIEVSRLEKAPEVLFVTEDGVEVREGDTYWFYWIKNPASMQYVNIPYEAFNAEKPDRDSVCSPNAKFFSTKEATEKHIDDNKPIYSKKQIKEALEDSFVRENYILDVPCCCADRFKEELFMKKLGL